MKPDNVVLDEDGHALLTDFGLSKEGMMDNLSTKSFCGSVAYLAPEMLAKSGHGKAVDWYLLGVLIYEMTVGMPPYFTNNRKILFENIKKGPLKLPMFLSNEICDLIMKLLQRTPQKRLGAGKGDADEVKKHPWFAKINWNETLKRGLKPPKPKIKPIPQVHLSTDFTPDTSSKGNHLKGWVYIAKHDP